MTTTQVYLILQLDRIRDGFMLLTGLLTVFYIIRIMVPLIGRNAADENDKKDTGYWDAKLAAAPPWKSAVALAAAFGIVMAFMPDTKTAAAAFIAPQIANSSVVQQDIPELYNLAIYKLKSALGAAPVEAK